MRDALVFNGASNLDFQEIRSNVIRIPEVVERIREAQKIWDGVATLPLDLANFIASEDEVFLSHIKLKSFASAVVQVGLLERHLKSYPLPEFVLGAVNGDSPLRVAIGQQSFFDLVAESAAACAGKPKTPSAQPIARNALELPILAGVQLVEYAVFRRSSAETGAGGAAVYERLPVETRELERMIVTIVEEQDVHRLVMVGPGSSISGRKLAVLGERDVQILESIDLDPMLSWFWSKLKEDRLAIAN